MRKMERDVLVGWFVVLLVVVAHFLITVSLGNTYFAESTLNRMLWFTSFPAFLIAFGMAFFKKTNTVTQAIRRGVIWTAEMILGFSVVAWVFGSFEELFVSPGVYWMFGAVLIAPIVFLMAFRRQQRGGRLRTP